jgi:hypothetical protein
LSQEIFTLPVSRNLRLLEASKIWVQLCLKFVWSKNMNMIPTGAFLTEMDASEKKETLAEQFVSIWEKKNSKIARAGGVSLMALSLAACGSSSTTTSSSDSSSSDDDATTPVGQAFVLAATADVITGTAGDDTISGTSGSIDGDTINAGAGDDTLSITVSIADDDLAAFAASGLETLQIRGTGAVNADEVNLDLGDVAGLETLEFRRMAEDIVITNLQSLSTELKISDTANSDSTVSITYDAAAVTGTSDTASLTVDNNTAGQDFTVNGVETIAVTAVGEDNDINIDGDDLATVTVAGAGDISIDVDASVETFTSTATGDVTMVATAAADVTATGGAGDDTFTMGTTLTAADTIEGGEGADTVGVTGAGGAVMPASAAITGVETLSITTGGADTYDASIVAFDNVTVTAAANAHTIAMTKLTTETVTVQNGSAAGAADDDIADINLALSDATGAADSITLNLTNNDADNEMLVTTTDFGVADVETVNIVFARAADVEDAAEFNIADINSSHDNLNLSGTADVTIDAKDSSTTITSTVVGDVDLTVGAADVTVTMGAGDDTIAFGGTLTSDDTVEGGDGDDELTATLAAGTAAAAITGVETATLTVTNAGATFSGTNVDDMTTIVATAASDQNVTLTNLDASVANVQIANTAADNNAVTVRYAAGTDSAHTLTIADDTATPAADVELGAVTIAGNAGALSIVSDGFTGNHIYDLTADDATSLSISSTLSFEIDAGGAGSGTLSATSATSATFTSAGEAIVVDGTSDLSAATAITVDGADGDITLTGAITATAMETLSMSAAAGVTTTTSGAITSDADVTSVTLTATGASADLSVDGLVDVDHVRTVTATATGGGNIDIADIELLGVDSDGTTDIVTSISLTANGEDASENSSTITVAAINTAAATLDTLTLASDADGTLSVTTGAASLTITAIDATGSLGTLTLDTSAIAAAIDADFGAGTNDITTEVGLADEINLAAGAGTDTINVQSDNGSTSAADIVRNFEAGAGGDVISLDLSELDGANGGADIVNGAGTDVTSALVVNIQSDADGTFTLAAATNIIAITNTYATSADVDTALSDAVTSAEGGLSDNDNLLVMWTNGADTIISRFQINDADPDADDSGGAATVEAFDEVEDLVILEGVAIGDVVAANFEFV